MASTKTTGPYGNAKILRGYRSSKYGQLHYRFSQTDNHEQTPLLCLHMSPSSGRVYERLLSHLCEERVGVAPDAPGFGESDPPPQPLEISDFAETNFALLDELGITGAVDVMGYHTGSLTACEMARQEPERIRKIVLVSTPMLTDSELEQMRKSYKAVEVQADGSHLLERWQVLLEWSDKRQTLESTMEHFAEHIRAGSRYHWGVLAAFNYRLQDVLPTISQPILLLNPEDDLQEFTRRAVPLLQNGHLHELPNCNHGFMDVVPEEIAGVMRQFLD